MSFDGVVTSAAVHELKRELSAGKVKKVHQPQPEQLLFNIYTSGGNRYLFISVSGSHSGIYTVRKIPENPAEPPVFCMVLRKHLSGARITDILQYQNDRIVEIIFETVNELGYSVNKKLIVEIMGKHSNAILTDMETGRIIDCIKHVSIDVNRARQLLPGKKYEYPPAQEKIPFMSVTENEISDMVSGQLQPDRAILSGIQGISPSLAQSMTADIHNGSEVYNALQNIISDISAGSISPSVYLDDENKPVDFHIEPLAVYEDVYRRISFSSFSEAAEYFFSNKSTSNTVKQKSGDLKRLVKAQLDKLRLKMQRLNEDLYKAENSDKYRLFGELLTANLHAVRPGAKSVTVMNYYDGSMVDIPLDPRFPASKNAQNYYKRYGKAKTAIKEKKLQLEETGSEINYLESVYEFADKADSLESLDMIRQELTDSGFIRYKKSRNRKPKKAHHSPYTYILDSGLRVLAGRNNNENDWLTLRKAAGTDIWLHTKDIPGSHVILFTEGVVPSDKDLADAAAIAAFHSKAKDSENVPVDYTRVRYVKKPSGAKPGMVIFTHNKTLYVSPAVPDNNSRQK